MNNNPTEKCGLCSRPLGTERIQFHHLVPKTFGGKVTVPIHAICHRKIHSLFTERELLKSYHTYEQLLTHDDIKKFVSWVAKKDPAFYDGSDTAKRKK